MTLGLPKLAYPLMLLSLVQSERLFFVASKAPRQQPLHLHHWPGSVSIVRIFYHAFVLCSLEITLPSCQGELLFLWLPLGPQRHQCPPVRLRQLPDADLHSSFPLFHWSSQLCLLLVEQRRIYHSSSVDFDAFHVLFIVLELRLVSRLQVRFPSLPCSLKDSAKNCVMRWTSRSFLTSSINLHRLPCENPELGSSSSSILKARHPKIEPRDQLP